MSRVEEFHMFHHLSSFCLYHETSYAPITKDYLLSKLLLPKTTKDPDSLCLTMPFLPKWNSLLTLDFAIYVCTQLSKGLEMRDVLPKTERSMENAFGVSALREGEKLGCHTDDNARRAPKSRREARMSLLRDVDATCHLVLCLLPTLNHLSLVEGEILGSPVFGEFVVSAKAGDCCFFGKEGEGGT
jgi:hypothetical protein